MRLPTQRNLNRVNLEKKDLFEFLRLLTGIAFIIWVIGTGPFSRTETTETGLKNGTILSFHSEILVHNNRNLTVTEIFQLNIKKKQKGIYLKFPAGYQDMFGLWHIPAFKLLKAECDRRIEPVSIKTVKQEKQIYIGKSSTILKPGNHIFTIVYQTNQHLIFSKEHTELHWSILGNSWNFPINKASLKIILPKEIPRDQVVIQRTTVSGSAENQNFSYVTFDSFDNPVINTTTTLKHDECLNVLVVWPRGYIKPPGLLNDIWYLIRDNVGFSFAIIGLLVILLYYYITWLFVGRDSDPGDIEPYFNPPLNLSPAVIYAVTHKKVDVECFKVALTNLSTKGFIKFSNQKIIKEKYGYTNDLAREEQLILNHFFTKQNNEFQFQNMDYHSFTELKKQFENTLTREYELNIHYNSNYSYWWIGLCLSIIVGLPSFIDFLADGKLIAFATTYFSVFIMFEPTKTQRSYWIASTFSFLIGCFTYIAFSLIRFNSLHLRWTDLIVIFFIVVITFLFSKLLAAPSPNSKKLLVQIKGFEMFLSETNLDRLAEFNPPEPTRDLFEKYLPYAVALNVQDSWAKRFATTVVLPEIPQIPPWDVPEERSK